MIVGAKVVKVTEGLAKEHYKHLSEKPFFGELIDFIQGKLHDLASLFFNAQEVLAQHLVDRAGQGARAELFELVPPPPGFENQPCIDLVQFQTGLRAEFMTTDAPRPPQSDHERLAGPVDG